MNIYFIGVGGNGLGPLAEFAQDAGFGVFGSDAAHNATVGELFERGISVKLGEIGADFLDQVFHEHGLDWVVYSSAITEDHPELTKARELGIKATKRNDLINFLMESHGLEMLAVAGTHGKTTTTTMLAWVFEELGIPASHLIGAPIEFGAAGQFVPGSQYLIYEADEYDRNFLSFRPTVSLIATVDYDHADIYPTRADYLAAFREFASQSGQIVTWQKIADELGLANAITLADTDPELKLPGQHRRQNASLVLKTLEVLGINQKAQAATALNNFPTARQRFEKLANNLYTDYAHTPEEIKASLQMAREIAKPDQKIIAIYKPHSNDRQRDLMERGGYGDAFNNADQVYWLPTFLARVSKSEKIWLAEDLIKTLDKNVAEPAEIDQNLLGQIKQHLAAGDLVIFLGAADDSWLRNLAKSDLGL